MIVIRGSGKAVCTQGLSSLVAFPCLYGASWNDQ